MDVFGWVQLLLFMGILLLVAKPMGLYLVRVLEPDGRTWLDRPVRPVERLLYRVLGIDRGREQDWKTYARSLIVFSLAGMIFTYAVLRLQRWLPLNPQGFGPVPPDLAFNTAASFATNTNWQNYAGEATFSYFSQMVGLVFHNFVSAAAGIAAAAALVRGISRHSASDHRQFLGRPRSDQPLPSSSIFRRPFPFPDLSGHRSELSVLRPGRADRERLNGGFG